MRFRLYREHGALNSKPIFDAFEQGVKSLGHDVVTTNEDVSVIWSVLWAGRMRNNREIYHRLRNQGKPVIIIEVGNLIRNKTWRICLNHINGLGIFGNDSDLDLSRPQKLGIYLKDRPKRSRPEILIACQHSDSLQWEGMPSMQKWAENTIAEIQRRTNRKIVVRPHPRSLFSLNIPNVIFERPQRVDNTYDDFNIDYNFHCVVNYNSGPAVQAAIHGSPIICDSSSLAYPVSEKWENIENPQLPNREDWLLKLSHTEWTVEEIAQGIPLGRIIPKI